MPRARTAQVKALERGQLNELIRLLGRRSKQTAFAKLAARFGPLNERHTWDGAAGSPLRIPPFDGALKKHRARLETAKLLTVIEALMRDVSRCEYAALEVAIAEVVRRRDVAAHQRLVKAYRRALARHDAGHREHALTIHDRLLDTWFPRLEPAALAQLLAAASDAELHVASGDGLLNLFEPGCRKATATEAPVLRRRLERSVAGLEETDRKERDAFDAFIRRLQRVSAPAMKAALGDLLARRTTSRGSVDALTAAVKARRRRLPAGLTVTPALILSLGRLEKTGEGLVKRTVQMLDVPALRTLFKQVCARGLDHFGALMATRLVELDFEWLVSCFEKTKSVGYAVQLGLQGLLAQDAELPGAPTAERIAALNEHHARVRGRLFVRTTEGWELLTPAEAADPDERAYLELKARIVRVEAKNEPDWGDVLALIAEFRKHPDHAHVTLAQYFWSTMVGVLGNARVFLDDPSEALVLFKPLAGVLKAVHPTVRIHPQHRDRLVQAARALAQGTPWAGRLVEKGMASAPVLDS